MTREIVLSIFVFGLLIAVINLYYRVNSILRVFPDLQNYIISNDKLVTSHNEALKMLMQELKRRDLND